MNMNEPYELLLGLLRETKLRGDQSDPYLLESATDATRLLVEIAKEACESEGDSL